jgi:hypothetical protein
MIPSRPLDLGAIINESIRIIKLIYWRAAVLLFFFYLPGLILMQVGLEHVMDTGQEVVQKYANASPEAPSLIRDYIVSTGTFKSSSLYYFRLQYPELFTTLDSVKVSVQTKYPDSAAQSIIESRLDSIGAIVKQAGPIQTGGLYSGIVFFSIGLFIFLIGVLANVAASYDLSSRAFEDRPLNFGSIFGLALKRTVWLTFLQYMIIWFAMFFGFSIVVGITYLISPVLGVLGVLLSIAAIAYSFLRTIFSPIALVSEELGPVEGIKRSLELTEGMFWRILGIGLIGWILATTISVLLRLPVSLAFSPGIDWLVQYVRGDMINITKVFHDFRMMIYGWEGLLLFSSLVSASFMPAFLTTFYYDLRTRKDGPLEYHSDSESVEDATAGDAL